jgi:hypothetical protein
VGPIRAACCLPSPAAASSSGRTATVTTLDFTVNTDPAHGPATLSAVMTSGPTEGDSINAVPVVAHPNPDCATGLTALTLDLAELTWS